jgi:hypothetical protein
MVMSGEKIIPQLSSFKTILKKTDLIGLIEDSK